MKFIPQKIREAREKLGISGEDLCHRLIDAGLSISRQTLSSWENGDTSPTLKQFEVLSYILNQPVGFFFGLKLNFSAEHKGKGRFKPVR